MAGDILWRGDVIMDPTPRLIPAACHRPLPPISPAVGARCIISADCFQCDFDWYQIHAVVWFTDQKPALKGYQLPASHHITFATTILWCMWWHQNAPHLLHLPMQDVSCSVDQREWGVTWFCWINTTFRSVSDGMTAQVWTVYLDFYHSFIFFFFFFKSNRLCWGFTSYIDG